jgi:deaminated glutathione amidase
LDLVQFGFIFIDNSNDPNKEVNMTVKPAKAAAIQMASGPNVNANLLEAGRLIAQAVESGAELVVLPENFALMGLSEQDKVKHRESEKGGVMQDFLSTSASKHGIWLVGGTIPMASSDQNKIRSTCFVYNDQGEKVLRYDKIHLFDVHLFDNDEHYTESDTIEAGNEIKVIDTPFGKLGVGICYDLRFPELFRKMMDKGAEIMAIPSAFTAITGKAHWEILVRSRAIENLCYVIAADQGGYHINGRETYGNSMIVDPWGQTLALTATGTGVAMAEISLEKLNCIRTHFPTLEHRKITCS